MDTPPHEQLPILNVGMSEEEDSSLPKIQSRAGKLTIGKSTVHKYKRRIAAGMSLQKKQLQRWKNTFLKVNSGIDPDYDEDTTIAGDHDITLNLYQSTLESFVAAVYSRNPFIYIWPGEAGFAKDAEIAERVINHDWRTLKAKRLCKKLIKDAWMFGLGIAKIGINQKQDTNLIVNKRLKNYDWLLGKSGIFFKRVSPNDIIFDSSAREIEDSSFVAHRLIYPVNYVKKNKNYENTKDITGTALSASVQDYDDDYAKAIMSYSMHGHYGEHRREVPNDMKKAILWEVHDREAGVIITLADGVPDAPLRVQKMDFWHWNFLVFRSINDRLYALPDMAAWENLVDLVQDSINIQIEHMKNFNWKLLYEGDNAIDEEEVKNLKSWKDQIVKVKEITAFNSLNKPSISPEIYQITSQLLELIRQQSGMNEFQRGGFSQGASATEAAIVDSLSKLRIGEKIDIFEDFIEDTAQLLLELRQEFTDEIENIPADPQDPNPVAVRFDKSIIQGPLFARIEAGSTVPISDEQRKQDAAQVLNTLAPLAQFAGLNLAKLVTDYLKAYGRSDINSYFNQQQDQSLRQDMGGQEQGQQGQQGQPNLGDLLGA